MQFFFNLSLNIDFANHFVSAQIVIASFALVFSGEPFGRRLLAHWSLLLLCAAASQAGRFTFEDGSYYGGSHFLLWLPLYSLAAQLPFWIARMGFGWRLVRLHAKPPLEAKLRIADLMLGTAIIALVLVFVKPYLSRFDMILGYSAIYVFCSLVIASPLAQLYLRESRHHQWAWAAVIAYPVIGITLVLVISVISAVSNGIVQQVLSFVVLVIVILCPTVVMAFTFSQLRTAGWRLERVERGERLSYTGAHEA
ncbi:hypothetical protein ETAA8_42930 [Anatilimnocola aggregata]|uniref:Uncharacterized protein n=1 Tax=Anatilimnocola aggregata TaxID=2528021 RepID=A0A517YG33_9BACT|nr:hypothetical protein [Anatilimnocola aggregata]QDU29186.1 hypothetical protein ETAA8_42930 [Anatilimnocola aggregata]